MKNKSLLDTFASRVVGFSECDGILTLSVLESPGSTTDMSWGWHHMPPNHNILIEEDGKILSLDEYYNEQEKLEAQVSERRQSAIDKQMPLNSQHFHSDDRIAYSLYCRAGYVSQNSFYQVPHGFETRVVGFCQDEILKYTIDLWENPTINDIIENKLAHAISQMFHFGSLDHIEDILGDVEFSKRDLYDIFTQISSIKEKITKIERNLFSESLVLDFDMLNQSLRKTSSNEFNDLVETWNNNDALLMNFFDEELVSGDGGEVIMPKKPRKTATQVAKDAGMDMSKIVSEEPLNTAPYPEDMGLCGNCLGPLRENQICLSCKGENHD